MTNKVMINKGKDLEGEEKEAARAETEREEEKETGRKGCSTTRWKRDGWQFTQRGALLPKSGQEGSLLRAIPHFLNKGHMVFFETVARRGQLEERKSFRIADVKRILRLNKR